MENHVRIGGLGSAVAEMMADNGVGKRLVRIGIDDTYRSGASLPYLMRKHEIRCTGIGYEGRRTDWRNAQYRRGGSCEHSDRGRSSKVMTEQLEAL